jgi:hypothetical protein
VTRKWLTILLSVNAWLALPARADEAPPPPQPLPVESDSLAKARGLVPGFRQEEHEHFVLLTDAPAESVQKVAVILEDTHDDFHANCRRLALKPAPLRHKLVGILFRDKAAFAAFRQANGQGAAGWAGGYYEPGADRLVIYDTYGSPEVQQALKKARQTERKIERQAPADRRNQLLQENRERVNRMVIDAELDFYRKVAHEAAHQLFCHTGIQKPGVMYPRWLAEGLATAFEIDEMGDDTVGFFARNEDRRDDYQEAIVGDRLIPLRVLLTRDLMEMGAADGKAADMQSVFYAQAHVFTVWLATARASEFRLYLEALRDGTFAVPSRREPVFESIFGPISVLERVWLRAEARAWPKLMDTTHGRRLREFEAQAPRPAEAAPAQPDAAGDGGDKPAGTPPPASTP